MSLSDDKRDETIRKYIKEERENFKKCFINWFRKISKSEEENSSINVNPTGIEELKQLYLKAPKPKIIPSDKDFQMLIFKSAGIQNIKSTKKK